MRTAEEWAEWVGEETPEVVEVVGAIRGEIADLLQGEADADRRARRLWAKKTEEGRALGGLPEVFPFEVLGTMARRVREAP